MQQHLLISIQGHDILRAMVNSGIPVRESTKTDVPSLLPLPAAENGFEWHQRRRRRHRRRPGDGNVSSPALAVERRESAVSRRFDHSRDGPVAEQYRNIVESSEKFVDGADLSKGVFNGEGCAAAAVVAATEGQTKNVKRGLGLGWLLVSDWKYKNSEMEREARGEGLWALERKRRRMQEFSQKTIEQQHALEKVRGTTSGGGSVDGVVGACDDKPAGSVAEPEAAAQIDLRPGGKRGRNEALTLRMRVRRTPGVLGRGGNAAGR